MLENFMDRPEWSWLHVIARSVSDVAISMEADRGCCTEIVTPSARNDRVAGIKVGKDSNATVQNCI